MKYIYYLVILFFSSPALASIANTTTTPQQASVVAKEPFRLPIERGKRKKENKSRKKHLRRQNRMRKHPQLDGSKAFILEVFLNVFITLSSIGGYTFFILTMFVSSLSTFWFVGIFGFCIIPWLSIIFSILPSDGPLYMAPSLLVSILILGLGGGLSNLIVGLVARIPFLWIMGMVILIVIVLSILVVVLWSVFS